MRIQAEVSIYPLKTNELAQPIKTFCRFLEHDIHEIHTGTMSTLISGESNTIFSSIQHAYEMIAKDHKVVMTLKISNACPETGSIYADNKSS